MPTSSGDGTRPTPRLVVEGLSAGYVGTPVVHEISLSVGEGEKVAIVGPNGAGKSTVLKAVIGEITVSAGRVAFEARNVTRMRSERLAQLGVGYVPQVRDIFDTLTVEENLDMGGYRLSRDVLASRIEEVLELFPRLKEMRNRISSRLSGGERKMLAIARTLMMRPRLLILDEPSANLAPDLARRVLQDYVGRLAETGVSVLLVEQRVREALAVCDWGYVLVGGSNRLEGPASELLDRPDLSDIFLGAEPGEVGGPLRAAGAR
jgi:branched-chain amino acid transport system ATP-binding protein